MASEEVKSSFCRYDFCVITDQLATDAVALERELLGRGDDRQDVITAPLVADRHLRRMSHFPPGAARPCHNPHAGLVLKRDIRPHFLR